MMAELATNAGRVLIYEHLLMRDMDPDNTGGSGPVRNITKKPRHKPEDDASNPTCIIFEPRVGPA